VKHDNDSEVEVIDIFRYKSTINGGRGFLRFSLIKMKWYFLFFCIHLHKRYEYLIRLAVLIEGTIVSLAMASPVKKSRTYLLTVQNYKIPVLHIVTLNFYDIFCGLYRTT
jgi:hypothetical protein